ncbi:MAG: flagellar basal-body rod protein FlgG, partial [Candidatus Omnitrophica bacterium]|nr:flagellar basal-body rod protein FlgG [Candidatus Omnitrophota bacterium]MBD3269669.1 flagellar basal-body rod protein FlgG [Candidatus Omnitrophota bacterium]
MMRSLWTSATGMYGQQVNIDTISNNLANVNTTGFKKSRVDFKDLFYQTLKLPGTPVAGGELQLPVGSQIGLGTRPAAIFKIFSQEGFQETQNPLDLAVEGDGFFEILRPDGSSAYTRDGSFKIDSEGTIVTSSGYILFPEITVPEDAVSISISKDGEVSVLYADNTTDVLGNIELTRFINPSGLRSIGDNLYTETEASGLPVTGIPGEEGLGTI